VLGIMNTIAHPFHSADKLVDWTTLTPDKIEADIDAALVEGQAEIDAICKVTPEEATFENTFLALEAAGETLSRAWGRIGHLTSVKDSEALREAHRKMLPKVTEYSSRIPLNAELWAALKSFAEKPAAAELAGVQKRFFEETMADFRQAGADLPAEKKARLEALNEELAERQRYIKTTCSIQRTLTSCLSKTRYAWPAYPSLRKLPLAKARRARISGATRNRYGDSHYRCRLTFRC